MRSALSVARTGLDAVAHHRLRSAVVVACVVAALLPYLVALGVGHGLLDQAEVSLAEGADLTVTGLRFGRPAPLDLAAVETVRRLPGVTDAWPRVVGEVQLGRDGWPAVVVGVPADRLPASLEAVEGRLFAPGATHELVVGRALASRLALRVGAFVPPFYENERGVKVSRVVGVFRADAPLLESNVVLTSVETALAVFAQQGVATEVLVRCGPDYVPEVRRAILSLRTLGGDDGHGPVRPRVVTRDDARAILSAGVLHREGVVGLHFLLAFAVGIPLVLVTSGIGLAERRREVGLLKAVGWHTDQVLLRAGVECLVLAVLAASASVLLAALWLGPLRGTGVAALLLDATDTAPDARIPWRLTPVPVLLASAVALAVVLSGTLVSTWRTAGASPAEALR